MAAIENGLYLLENWSTQCYLLQSGEPIKGQHGDEGSWAVSPPVVGASDSNSTRSHWKIIPQGDNKHLIENPMTQRYLLQTGEQVEGQRGNEGGWDKAPSVVGSDENYEGRALWKILSQDGENYLIENIETQRYLFQSGEKTKIHYGEESKLPATLGSDANYYNRALWKITPKDASPGQPVVLPFEDPELEPVAKDEISSFEMAEPVGAKTTQDASANEQSNSTTKHKFLKRFFFWFYCCWMCPFNRLVKHKTDT